MHPAPSQHRSITPVTRRRSRSATARCLAALAATFILHNPVAVLAQQATSWPSFGQVDYFWTRNPQRFQSLWQAARTQTVRIAVLGDSQETNPGGEGSVYIPRLNLEMWKRFGNVPETPVQGCSSYGGGAPWADWLLRGSCVAPGPVPTRLTPDQILPGVAPAAFSTLNGATNISGGYLGQLTQLQQDAIDIDPAAAIPGNVNYFNTSGVLRARIFAATAPSSGEVGYWVQPTDSSTPSFYAPITATGSVTPGLGSSVFTVKSADTAPLDFAGKHYLALQVAGTDDTKLTDIVGLRFFNETHPEGVSIDTFSRGGYEAMSFLANHNNAGEMFQALDFKAVILHYGANDAGNDVSAQAFQANCNAIIALVRSWVGDPNLPVILISDVYRDRLTAAQQSQFDQYVGAQLAIAQGDSNVMVINSRRLMDDIGWNANSGQSSTFLVDGVHYTAQGAQVLAAAETAAMMGEVLVSRCATDSNVALQSTATLTVDLGGPSPCTGYGQLAVPQTLTLDQPTLNVVLTNGFTPTSGQSFRILSWGTLTGSFATIQLPALPSGLAWDTAGLYTNGTLTAKQIVAPTLQVSSGGNQTFAAGASAEPVVLTLTGIGPFTVGASSSNTTLLPVSGISLSAGCGSAALTCTANIAAAGGQIGAATVTLTVRDSLGQSASATVTVNVTRPAAPTINITTGGSQSLQLGAVAAPVAFTLTGSGVLTVTAVSSNTTLLPGSGVTVTPGCGSTLLSCAATLGIAAGQTGSAMVVLTIADSSGQTVSGTVNIQVAAAPPASTLGNASGGGGGAVDVMLLLQLAAVAVLSHITRSRRVAALNQELSLGATGAAPRSRSEAQTATPRAMAIATVA